eukprot:TRINITY_DN110979_c0_g1_i1.p1 TRINITY_DN110979_c0_g1~~TRINITY_DN110979_c0_g1_i1.p1  ORF type:complete len:340 (-),score=25.32 TRINITY_DN110979_c0_g1_i1:327-1346(-)
MAEEIKTVAGAVGVVGTSVLAAVTFGQVEGINEAVRQTAKYTGNNFMQSGTRHLGEMVGTGVATAATLGLHDETRDAFARSACAFGEKVGENVNNLADSLPGVGHVKGSIHYACGDQAGGDRAMKSATRTSGVIGGAVGGALAGTAVCPVFGTIAGGAIGGVGGGAAMDGTITGVESAIHGEYRPHGQIAAWTKAINNENPQALIDGIVGVVTTPVGDAVTGACVGAAVGRALGPRPTGSGSGGAPRSGGGDGGSGAARSSTSSACPRSSTSSAFGRSSTSSAPSSGPCSGGGAMSDCSRGSTVASCSEFTNSTDFTYPSRYSLPSHVQPQAGFFSSEF